MLTCPDEGEGQSNSYKHSALFILFQVIVATISQHSIHQNQTSTTTREWTEEKKDDRRKDNKQQHNPCPPVLDPIVMTDARKNKRKGTGLGEALVPHNDRGECSVVQMGFANGFTN